MWWKKFVSARRSHEHTETVRDAVRRKDVHVEEAGGAGRTTTRLPSRLQAELCEPGHKYDYYAPAYQFGSTYANDSRYRDRDWNSVESDVRRDWEARGEGNGKNSRMLSDYGWDRVRGRR